MAQDKWPQSALRESVIATKRSIDCSQNNRNRNVKIQMILLTPLLEIRDFSWKEPEHYLCSFDIWNFNNNNNNVL